MSAKSEVYTFSMLARAIPGSNNKLQRIPRVVRWQQVIRSEVHDRYGISRLGSRGASFHLEAPFRLGPRDWAAIEVWFYFRDRGGGDGVNLLKPVEDALLSQDREVLDGTYHVRRGQAHDFMAIRFQIYREV